MATNTTKSTYSLDVDTVRHLENPARHWNTSKSGALRRAIRSAAAGVYSGRDEALDALDCLQDMLALDHHSTRVWKGWHADVTPAVNPPFAADSHPT